MMKYHPTASQSYSYYFYETNLQGDIVAIYDSNGAKVVSFTYDAWGNFTATVVNTTVCTNFFIEATLFRYRGYIYDYESNLYYLQSRYYDPETGRFISADGVIANVGSLHGYNTYSYCFNNPINFSDSTGNWPEWIENIENWICDNVIDPVTDVIDDIISDFKNYNTNNTSETVVFQSNYFSNYKGKFVIKTPFDASFSFGFIGLSIHQQNSNTLKHEYGHTVQMDNMGVVNYVLDVAIPSSTINMLSRMGKLKYDYYGAPWEAEADKLGGVVRNTGNTPWPAGAYNSYWDLLVMFIT